jgi:hypothetical protein
MRRNPPSTKERELPGPEIPQVYKYRGYQLGIQIIYPRLFRKKPDKEVVEHKSDYADSGENRKFQILRFYRPLFKDPDDTESVVYTQPQQKGKCGGQQVVKARVPRKQKKRTEIENIGDTPDEGVAKELHGKTIRFGSEQIGYHEITCEKKSAR